MNIDFEQTKRELSGRSILVTSWYDEQEKNWRASVPRYSHVRALQSVDQESCSTRSAAIDQVIDLLKPHFAEKDSDSSGGLYFL